MSGSEQADGAISCHGQAVRIKAHEAKIIA